MVSDTADMGMNSRDRPTAAADVHLTDYLQPPQAADELGRLDGYSIRRILGSGGMGVVFAADDLALNRRVAVKVLKREIASSTTRQRFLREARAMAAVVDHHVIGIHHVADHGPLPYLVMPLLDGETLQDRLTREVPLPLADVLRIGRETASGLSAAHAASLIHRDIKPANIWLERVADVVGPSAAAHASQNTVELAATARGNGKFRVKILDFGLARTADEAGELTRTGAMVGTIGYMAPEQVEAGEVDARCDLFALGAVLYHAATGKFPFTKTNNIAFVQALATETPRTPQEWNARLPQDFSDLVMRLLAKQPHDRPQSAHEVVVALQCLEQQAAPVPVAPMTSPAEPPAPAEPPRIRRGLKILGGVGIALAACALLFGATMIRTLFAPAEANLPSRDSKQPPVEASALPSTFTNRLGMKFVLVASGQAKLGGSGGKPGKLNVDIPHDFYLGAYEVTQEEWHKLMEGPSHFSRTGSGKEAVKEISDDDLKRFPADNVRWHQCVEFLSRLNQQFAEPGWRYRLPTMAEWEYACRGGPLTKSDDLNYDFYLDRLLNSLPKDAANFDATGWQRTCKVGLFRPNSLGLHDMHGNVWEWCDDAIADDAGVLRAYRGGSWFNPSTSCRAAYYTSLLPHDEGTTNNGLRVARVRAEK